MLILGLYSKTQKKDFLKRAENALFFMKLLGCATLTVIGSSFYLSQPFIILSFSVNFISSSSLERNQISNLALYLLLQSPS